LDDVAVAVVAAVVILSAADDRRDVGTFISDTISAGIIILLFVSKVFPVCAARYEEAGANAEQTGMMTAAAVAIAVMDSFAMVVANFVRI
jgi:hypothetical protein